MINKSFNKRVNIKGRIIATIRDAKSGKVKRVYKHDNIIVTVGRTVLTRLLSGDATYSGEITYGALGTGTTAPANADTTLETESFRKVTSSQTYSDNIAYIDFYYTATDCDGTYKEFGNFIDGEAGVDTGQLFSHVAVNWVKSNTESLTVSCIYTIT